MTLTPETRIMFDSVNLAYVAKNVRIPPHSLIAYYCDGPRAILTPTQVQDLFPDCKLNPIDVNGTRAHEARTADCETEDITPDMLEQWLTDFKNTNPAYEHGARGEIYCDRNNIPLVRRGTGKYVLGVDYYLWIATGDGSLYTGSGINACQNLWKRGYDTSVVFDPRFLPSL